MKQIEPIDYGLFRYEHLLIPAFICQEAREYNVIHAYSTDDSGWTLAYVFGDAELKPFTQEILQDFVNQFNDYRDGLQVVDGLVFEEVNPEESTPRDIALQEAVLAYFAANKKDKPSVYVGFDRHD